MRGWSLLVLAAIAGCGRFNFDGQNDAATDDSVPPVIVGFMHGVTLVDEASGLVRIEVDLSAPAGATVTVPFAVTGGTAVRGIDYLLSNGTLTFSPGDTSATIDVTILMDETAEQDETIAIRLTSATGARLGSSDHTITINSTVLPRVSFAFESSSATEGASPTLNVSLDTASSVVVMVGLSRTGTATGLDLGDPPTSPLVFAPGVTTRPVVLLINQDALDEDDETVLTKLVQPTNALIGTISTETHTILDDDPLPTVSFSGPGFTGLESGGSFDATVTLSAVSGRTVTVPFGLGAGTTASSPMDYSFGDSAPLVFPPGVITRSIHVNFVDDTVDEPLEVLKIDLGSPINAMLGVATINFAFTDNDDVCYGVGAYAVCLPTPPTGNLALPPTLDTDTSPLCDPVQPTGWLAGGQVPACFVEAGDIGVPGSTRVTGTRPLVLVGASSIDLAGLLDVASSRTLGFVGPGSPGPCLPFPTLPVNSVNGAGAGAGGSFMSRGGAGGSGDSGANVGGISPAAGGAPVMLRAGCDGQRGGDGVSSNANSVGRGGGAVYLVAQTIVINGTLNASGSGGAGATQSTGGSGGGSGGMIKLFATSVAVAGNILANGGGGASGGQTTFAGGDGADPQGTSPLSPASGGTGGSGAGSGGSGFAGPTQAAAGANGANVSAGGGGGGGGGGGFIESNGSLTGGVVSAGVINAP